MQRRDLLSLAALGGALPLLPVASSAAETAAGQAVVGQAVAAQPAAQPDSGPGAPDAGWRSFNVTTRVTLKDSPGAAKLFLPLAQSAGGYQAAAAPRAEGTGRSVLVRDARYGATLLRTDWDGGEIQSVLATQRVSTRDRFPGDALAQPLTEAERRFWTAGSESAPVDGIVRDTAQQIVAGREAPRDRLRAIYDWVVDNTWRDAATPGCGTGDVRTMLETRRFGGKCADINGLFVALARAAGLPTRDVYGIRVADSRLFPSLGRSGDIGRAQHCRAEAWLDETGWFPVDPADLRKVVLEEKLPLASEPVKTLRERLFGSWEMNWVGFNSATDIVLPGAGDRRPNFPFLMYPCAFTANGQPDSLDPAGFHYEITAREIAA